MDITSFVTSAAMMIRQSSVQQQVNVSLLKTAMNSAENNSAELLKAMEKSVQPHLGSKVDITG